jgi:hypothetical protein
MQFGTWVGLQGSCLDSHRIEFHPTRYIFLIAYSVNMPQIIIIIIEPIASHLLLGLTKQ